MVVNPVKYVQESKAELDKVGWPSKAQTLRLTIVVIIISVIVGLYVAGLDAIFAKFTERFLR